GDQAGDGVRPHTSPVVGRLAARASDTGRAGLAARRARVVEMLLGRRRRADGEGAREPPGSIVGETAENLVCRGDIAEPGRAALAARRDRVVEMQLGRGRRADGERARDPPGSIVGETAANLVCRAGAGQPGRAALVLVPVALEAAIGRARRDEPAVAIEAE